jgi:hypothetical protein
MDACTASATTGTVLGFEHNYAFERIYLYLPRLLS